MVDVRWIRRLAERSSLNSFQDVHKNSRTPLGHSVIYGGPTFTFAGKHLCRHPISQFRLHDSMIESREDIEGFPPFIVLERGCLTLVEFMSGRQMSSIEQMSVVYSVRSALGVGQMPSWPAVQVLEGLQSMHDAGIVHGNLHPSHIMWFSGDFTWKVISFSAATSVGEACRVQPNVSRFDSPELIEAPNRGLDQICIEPSMDIWSFGVIAFEVFTRRLCPIPIHRLAFAAP